MGDKHILLTLFCPELSIGFHPCSRTSLAEACSCITNVSPSREVRDHVNSLVALSRNRKIISKPFSI